MEKMDEKTAKTIYDQLCKALDARNWKYDKYEDDLAIYFMVKGEDIPMEFVYSVDADRHLVRLRSKLPFDFAEDKRLEGAIVTCSANYVLADGYFEYDITDGEIAYKITTSCLGSIISDETIQYMLQCALFLVEEFNDKFMMVSKGYMTVEQFLKDN